MRTEAQAGIRTPTSMIGVFVCLIVALGLVSAAPAAGFGYISSFGSSGTGPGQFEGPTGVAVDSQGNVYVTDLTSGDRIVRPMAPVRAVMESGQGDL